ncbi:TetR/AcrR family transcriptional regulator [Salinisphaera sp. SPP-AMP-43]|uniref:TetR/AcrR family transcriptional regulator n=1 Tax=Salinisphaera sp. SPP-AMP-43 TaxID=3121288 RepID=UPI003C6E3A97
MARPKNQAERRRQLVQAATDAILQQGASNARLSDIAQEAGLTPASVLYYYPDIKELFIAAFERSYRTYCASRESYVEQADGDGDKLAACIRSGMPCSGLSEKVGRVLYELMPVALRHDGAAELYRDCIARQVSLYQDILERGQTTNGWTLAAPADVLAKSFVALEDGYGFEVLIGGMTSDDAEQALFLHAESITGVDGNGWNPAEHGHTATDMHGSA